ncbi:hypothetical protein [Absidia glauca]|uniref:Uncharacterized protein n=1 Tax=Absidia glauca TaxID=4829 RepID=A0A168MMM2_ABSGL|nr:hypothetical protein [Absidia glauca]
MVSKASVVINTGIGPKDSALQQCNGYGINMDKQWASRHRRHRRHRLRYRRRHRLRYRRRHRRSRDLKSKRKC